MPASSQPAQSPTAQRANEVALDLYRAVAADQRGNLALSPLGIDAALVALQAGARGATSDEIAALLRPRDGAPGDAFDAFASVLQPAARRATYSIELATRVWAAGGVPIEPGYAAACARVRCDAPQTVDFGQREAAALAINDWIAARTDRRIERLIDPGSVDPKTALLLSNAVYFKAKWSNPFAVSDTKPADFFVAEDKSVKVPMMTRDAHLFHASLPDCDIAQIDYSGAVGMVIVVPKAKTGLAAMEQKLDLATWNRWMGALQSHPVVLFVPRFKAGARLALGKTLGRVGVKRALSGEADLSGLTRVPNVGFTDVVHAVTVDVDETGTVAAAATAAPAVMAAPNQAKPAVFRADRPFLFAIRDGRSGAILFMGHYTKP